MILCVDDILIIKNDIPTLKGVKTLLEKCFIVNNLIETTYSLSIKIVCDKSKGLIEHEISLKECFSL